MANVRLGPLRVVGCVATLALAVAATDLQAKPESLREGLFGDRAAKGPAATPPVARYMSEDGLSFVFDRTQRRPLLKFDNSPEVWALASQPAPRGDVIFKDDVGEPVLRATRLGGVTLFTDARPEGAAASVSGAGAPLRLSQVGPHQLLERLAQASSRASRAARRLIQFEAEGGPDSSAVIADAAIVTSESLVRISRKPGGRAALSRVSKVTLAEGRKPGASLQKQVLRITIVARDGYAGRPSSDKIMAATLKQ